MESLLYEAAGSHQSLGKRRNGGKSRKTGFSGQKMALARLHRGKVSMICRI